MGAYDLLLDWLYGNEKPLPLDPAALYRIGRAGSKVERDNVDAVLAEFFILAEGGYTQKRAIIEIERASHQREVNRQVGKLGGRPKMETEQEPNANRIGLILEPNDNPSQTPDSRQEQELHPTGVCHPASAGCPQAEIVELYHELLPANPRMKVWSGSRAVSLRTRWREDPKRQSLDYWRRFFTHVSLSEFLTGRVNNRDGRPFLPGLDWLLAPRNFAKVIEGRYHERT
jgi:uncharacterized protein YdaU (DUF1376 family)